MTPVNVVFMGNLLYPTGLAETKRFQHFIDGVMAGDGNSASVLLLRQSHPGRDESNLDGDHRGVRYRTIGQDIRADARLPWAVLRYLSSGCIFLRRARRDGVNVLFLYNEPNFESFIFVLWARLLGYRVVADIVEDAYYIADSAPLISRIKARSARWATEHLDWFVDGVVVISTYLQRKLAALVKDVPVQLIPISVDLARITQSGSGFHRPVRMLYAGNFGDKDDIESLIAAFEAVAPRHEFLELVMTGRAPEARMREIHARIARSPFAARIRYLGFLGDDEYFALLSDCDILCALRMPSDFANRGFPFKLGEYLATGRPVIASRVSDVSAYLTDCVNAILVEPGSVQQIVAALNYLLVDESRALALGRAGRTVAMEYFSASNNGVRLLELVARAVAR